VGGGKKTVFCGRGFPAAEHRAFSRQSTYAESLRFLALDPTPDDGVSLFGYLRSVVFRLKGSG
jgi:hypothetical protein